MLTYKQVWIRRILRLLRIELKDKRRLQNYLCKMTGHGLACLSNAIEEITQASNQSDETDVKLHKLDKDKYCIFCGIYKPYWNKCSYPETT